MTKSKKSVDEIIKELNDMYVDVAYKADIIKSYDRIPFPSPVVNRMLHGGIAVGRMVEFFGPEHGGKTTSALALLAQYQKMNCAKKGLIVDAEHAFDRDWAEKLGVVVKDVILIQPDGMPTETILDTVDELVSSGEIGFGIVDSVAAMVSKNAFGEPLENEQRAGNSKALSKFCNNVIPKLRKNKCTLIIINQIRDDMKNPYNLYVTTGGHALKHHSTVRAYFQKGYYIDANNNELTGPKAEELGTYGTIIKVVLKKDKTAPSTILTSTYTIRYDVGIDIVYDTIKIAESLGIVLQKGAWFSFVDPETGEVWTDEKGKEIKVNGKNEVYNYFKKNNDRFGVLCKLVDKQLAELLEKGE